MSPLAFGQEAAMWKVEPMVKHRNPVPRCCRKRRRGVLLLIVLSMLSLFMMLGVAYVVMASRARDASRGFAKVIAGSAESRLPVEQLLDSAAMLVIRGTNSGALPKALKGASPLAFESLLEDQYGTVDTLTGQVVSTQEYSPLVSISVSLNAGPSSPTNPVQLSGRILTLLPSSGRASSHRILRAAGNPPGPYTLWIANVGTMFGKPQGKKAGQGSTAGASAYNFPPAGTRIVINGREHSGDLVSGTNEPWDGHDFARNPFLAQVEPVPSTPSISRVLRASMCNASGTAIAVAGDVDEDQVPDQCDNDNDGVIDGQFFASGLPPLAAANGNTIVTHMSCLIVDLDGKFNVNAHGSVASMLYPNTHNLWPTTPTTWTSIPRGSGYGPADISGSATFAAFNAARPSPGSDTPWASLSLGAAPAMQYASTDRKGQGALTPDPGCRLLPLGLPALEGRYAGQAQTAAPSANSSVPSLAASGALPGVSGSNDLLSTYNERLFTGVRPPIDLHARMKVLAVPPVGSAVLPTLAFAKPDGSNEFVDDPYEVVLGQSKSGGILADPRQMGLASGAEPDNVFSIAELERVLRPYDADSTTLPPRLFALLGSQAEVCRHAVTTESWDTAAITGTAALALFGTSSWFSSGSSTVLYSSTGPTTANPARTPNGIVPPDLAAGLRLDVTRSGTNDLQRRALFKDVYLTCVALLTGSGNNPSAAMATRWAQWAANVVDYQDADSTMTQYEYDLQPLDGWDVDGAPATTGSEPTRATVWGAERPEVVITQTLAWEDDVSKKGELYVLLHRPWNSRFEIVGSGTTVAEPSDPALRATPTTSGSSIALSGTSPGGDNIWQLRIGTSPASPIVRFDPLPAGSTDLGSTATPPPQILSEFGMDAWLCVRPAAASPEGVTVPARVPSFPITNGSLRAPMGTTSIRLERLANPGAAHNATSNPYLVVDSADITVVPRTPPTPLPHEVRTRDQGWRQHFDSSPHPTSPPLSAQWGGNPEWLLWPNRPLISVVELTHVPGFVADSFAPRVAIPPTPSTNPDWGLLANYQPPSGVAYLPTPLLLDALRVPSRFAGTRLTIPDVAANATFLTNLERIGLYSTIVSVNQLDLAREPGRVNLNTITTDAVWDDVVVGGTHAGSTVPSRGMANLTSGSTSPAQPAQTLLNLLAVTSGNAATSLFQDTAMDISDAVINPLHRMHTTTRLANVGTNRSHLFAVWITLRTMEQTTATNPVTDPDTVRYHRMFFIYDRSKPVAFEPGRDHNARDGIILKRMLQ